MADSKPDIQSIFCAALDQNSAEELQSYLESACQGNAQLRADVERLLESHRSAGDFLKGGCPSANEEVDDQTTLFSTQLDGIDRIRKFLEPSTRAESHGRLGHYEVLECLGQGAYGIVFRAFDDSLQRVVAVKALSPEMATTSPPKKRFLREARTAAQVRHENVVQTYAVEEQPTPYLVMEYIPGETLQQRLDRSGPLGVQEVLSLGCQIARGLAAAHEKGLIHRDIKPSNILLEKGVEERVKISDFGLARAVADASLTQSGVIAGTPMYMAPEQTVGDTIDHRADLFSLGSVLYTMCSGRPPFRATTSMATLKRVAEDQPRPIREIIPEVPQWLCDIIGKLHAKNPDDRFQSAKEVGELLRQHLAHLENPTLVPMPVPVVVAPQTAAVAEEPVPLPIPTSPPRREGSEPKRTLRRRWPVAAAILLALFGGLSLTEATGVTRLRGTVIRLFTPEGTLVVETDDPAVKVTVEGDGDLVITGAGPQEVRLKAGSYRLKAMKDGKPVKLDRDLVAISRGDTQVVKVRVENEPPAAVVPKTESEAFVLLAAGKERKFDTLAEVVQSAIDGDTIEIRGNGPFVSQPINIGRTSLTIRAGQGFRPVIKLSIEGIENGALLRTDAPLVLEGLKLQAPDQVPPPDQRYWIVEAFGSSLHVANCRFQADLPRGGYCIVAAAPSCCVRNCEFLSRTGFPLHISNDSAKGHVIDNCLAVAQFHVLAYSYKLPSQHDASLHVTRNTLVSPAPVYLWLRVDEPAKELVVMRTRVDAAGNVFDATSVLQLTESKLFQANYKPLEPPEAEALLRQLLDWRERSNCYAAGAASFARTQDEWGAPPPHGPKSLADWERFWGAVDTDSQEGHIKYQGGNLVTKLLDSPEKLTPEDFRLRPDSAGYKAGKDGKDLGADVDLVGPGPAYERWKKTPDYQQWLKETEQIKK